MNPTHLDHVAVRVFDRSAVERLLVERLDVHVVERNERLTLLGPTATDGKLTLFDRAPDDAAGGEVELLLADDTPRAAIELADDLRIVFGRHAAAVDAPRHALIGLSLGVDDPAASAARYIEAFGFRRAEATHASHTVAVGTGLLELRGGSTAAAAGTGATGGHPRHCALDHVGLLVSSVRDHHDGAAAAGIPVLDVVDAANTLAVFVEGPDGVRIEYVEHKPEFALV